MTIRVTSQSYYTKAIQQGQQHNAQLAQLHNQASSGIRIHKPSDDPLAIRTLLARKIDDSQSDVFLANTQEARTKLNRSVSQLLEANNVLVRASEVALDGNQSTEPDVLAAEVDRLIERLVDIANSQDNGQFLYAGTGYKDQPFNEVFGVDGKTLSAVTYNGSQSSTVILIGNNATANVINAGNTVFQPRDRQATVFLGDTGAAPASGTDSGTGRATLLVQHTLTTFAGGSGVQAGISSATGDTIIGPPGAHVLTINDTSGTGASGTISLNGGVDIAFTNTDTNLQVTGPAGQIVYLDTTTITPGFSGTVAITANGSLSTDNGATTLPIDFSTGQQVVDTSTGQVTNIDTSAVRRSGTESIEYVGTSDVFQVLINLRDDLRNTRNLSAPEFHDAMARSIGDIQRVRDHMLSVVGEQSLTLENLDAVQRQIEDSQLETKRLIGEIESADITEVAIRLQEEQNLLQFTFATTVGLLDQSLLDFIR